MITPPASVESPTSRVLIPPVEEAAAAIHRFDLRQFWHSLVEKLWVVIICVVAGLLLALGYLVRTPKLYQSHSVLEVDVQEPTVVSEDQPMRMRSMFLASQEAMRTIEQNLTNRALLARVVRAEHLAGDGGKALIGQNIVPDTESTPKPTPANTAFGEPAFTPLEDALGGALSRMVKPVIRRGTRLIDLYVSHTDPLMAQRLTEAIGREYIRSVVERRAASTQESLRYLLEEEERLKERLQKSEAAVAEYKEKTPDALQLGGGAASTGSQMGAGSSGGRGGFVEDKLQEINTKLNATKADRLKLEGELQQIQRAAEDVDALLAIPSVAGLAAVNDRRRDVAQLQAAVATLSQRYKDKHPKMMAARAALAEAQAALKHEVVAAPALLRNMLAQAEATEQSLEAAAKVQEKAALALNKAAIGYQELARQAETDRALYESVLRQIKQTDLTKGVKATAVTVIERASLPGRPVTPNPPKAIALGLLGGLALGLGLIYGANVLDRTIKTVDQAEALLGLPVLAAIPDVKSGDAGPQVKGSPASHFRLVADAPDSPAAEGFRSLRAALSLLGPEAERRVFLFTSALPNEGKSFASANYAIALAQQGYRVLLLDGDLRRPSLHNIFATTEAKRDSEAKGVVDCLVGTIPLADAVRKLPLDDQSVAPKGDGDSRAGAAGELFVLGKGTRAPSPAELLSSPAFGELIAEALRLYDRVVVDSAPVLAVSDTLLMVPYVQSVCLVVRAASTARNAVHRSIAMLATAGLRPSGVVLNRLPRRTGGSYYYYYYSGSSYGDEGVYGAPSRERHRSARKGNGAS